MKGFLLPVIIIAVLGGIFGVTRASEAQDLKLSEVKISLNLTQIPLKKALDEIENQTRFTFAFSYNAINPHRPISVRAHDRSVERILKDLFKGYRVSWGVSGRVVLLKKWPDLLKNEKKNIESVIKGTVTDGQSGETLPGVNIRVKGTSTGTATDADGQYELSVESLQDTLVFSFVGYQSQQIPIDGRTTINISLETQAISGEEIVVVGYGKVRKSDLTGSVSTVDVDKTFEAPVSQIGQALEGRAAGVQVTAVNGAPGSGSTIRIRGGNSITAGNEPLYVIDGFIGGGDLSTIDPNDIKSIDILKGPSATAIYGTRGANGVVLIKTKRGTNDEVTIRTSQGFQKIPREIDNQNAREFADLKNQYADLKGLPEPFPDLNNLPGNTDWQQVVFKPAYETDNYVSVSHRSSNTNYFISANYFNQKGIVIGSGFNRENIRLNLDHKVNNRFKVGTSFTISRAHTDANKIGMASILKESPLSDAYDSTGAYTVTNWEGDPFNNPVAVANLKINENINNRLLNNLYAQYEPVDGLLLKSTFGADLSFKKNNTYLPGNLPTRIVNNSGGSGQVKGVFQRNLLSENTLNYRKTIAGVHSLHVLAGFTYQENTVSSMNLSGTHLTSDVTTFNNLDFALLENSTISTEYTNWKILSYLGRINYTLHNKYLLTLTMRRDGSSRLGRITGGPISLPLLWVGSFRTNPL